MENDTLFKSRATSLIPDAHPAAQHQTSD